MRVSYLELFAHCKKVFLACGIPYGYADDGAEAVAWSEIVGLKGLSILQKETDDILKHGLNSIEISKKSNNVLYCNISNGSAVVYGKAIADCALSLNYANQIVQVSVQNTVPSQALAKTANYVAFRNKGCLINYRSTRNTAIWMLATPENPFPFIAEGEEVENIMQQKFSKDLFPFDNNTLSCEEFSLYSAMEIELINSCVKELRRKKNCESVQLVESALLKAEFEKASHNGAEVDNAIWKHLDQIGRKILVKSSEQSRRRGAGENT
ncbi:DUF3726 domain-containing protein [uncultured Marinococcus sp.]|uniref:DUF3726 domain-containing protein n=1 Tax=uncultured Marinococcus sp. TaxID=487012 RepID=UPI0026162ED4|nr:DUF3726 domain-containing protein [uncultured Marinococcus sp.]